jgi:hypothetical protein
LDQENLNFAVKNAASIRHTDAREHTIYILKPKTLFLLVRNIDRIKLMIKTSKEVVFVLDKMNLKNSMIEFRNYNAFEKRSRC